LNQRFDLCRALSIVRVDVRRNPFKGTEVEQYGANPTPLELTAGKHTMHIISREKSYLDIIYATTDKGFDANGTPPVSVEPQNKLTTTWGALKRGF
jgi:hypothetical protein